MREAVPEAWLVLVPGPGRELANPHTWLAPAEQAEFAALPALRHRSWLAGRLAAKGAVLHALGGSIMAPDSLAAVCIVHDAAGRPQVAAPSPARALALSISHSGAAGAALVAAAGLRPGIDLEEVRPQARPDRLLALVGAGEDLRWWQRQAPARQDLALTALWCVREAAAKAWGMGLAEMAQVQVQPRARQPWTVQMAGHAGVGIARFRRFGSLLVAWTLWPEGGAAAAPPAGRVRPRKGRAIDSDYIWLTVS